jgi:hypothetical protein
MLSSVMHWETRISRRVPFNPDTKRGIGSEAKFNAGHRLCALTISGCQSQHKTRQKDVSPLCLLGGECRFGCTHIAMALDAWDFRGLCPVNRVSIRMRVRPRLAKLPLATCVRLKYMLQASHMIVDMYTDENQCCCFRFCRPVRVKRCRVLGHLHTQFSYPVRTPSACFTKCLRTIYHA